MVRTLICMYLYLIAYMSYYVLFKGWLQWYHVYKSFSIRKKIHLILPFDTAKLQTLPLVQVALTMLRLPATTRYYIILILLVGACAQ